MNLSRAFDIINQSQFTSGKTKSAWFFQPNLLSLLQRYLCNRLERRKINGSFSSWNEVITGVPKGSILGLLPFNTFLNDIFLFI